MSSVLDGLSGLAYRERCARLAAVGDRLRVEGDAEAEAELSTMLAHDDPWVRRQGVMLAVMGRRAAALEAMVQDPSRAVRCAASLGLCQVGELASLEALLSTQSHRFAVRMLQHLVRRGRADVVDAILATRVGSQTRWLERLPLASDALVVRHLERFYEHAGPAAWTSLARRHPGRCADFLVERISGTTDLDSRLRWRALGLIEVLCLASPAHGSRLLGALLDAGLRPGRLSVPLQICAAREPLATYEQLRARQAAGQPSRAPGIFGYVRFTRPSLLGPAPLAWLVTHAPTCLPDESQGRLWWRRLGAEAQREILDAWLEGGIGTWGAFLFGMVDPDGPDAVRRQRAYARWRAAAADQNGVISVQRLRGLPRLDREREARGFLSTHPWLRTRPESRVRYAGLLGFDEAEASLAHWLRHPEGDERARGLQALLSTVAHDPAAIVQALGAVRARRHEQDPVRLAMLRQLAALPPSRFPADLLGEVEAIVDEALEAADLSSATAGRVEELLWRVLITEPERAARAWERVLRVRGSLRTGFGTRGLLSEGQLRALDGAIEGLAARWAATERVGALLTVAAGVGRHLPELPGVLAALERVVREVPRMSEVGMALGVIARHAPTRLRTLVPELVSGDPSFALLPSVATHVSRHEQNLLEPLLGDGPLVGRFASGKTRSIFAFDDGVHRWSGRHHRLYAAQLIALIDDPDRDVPTCRDALSRREGLTWAPASPLLALVDDHRPAVVELVLRALPGLDLGDGLPVLLDCLDDGRARVAIYALRRCLVELPRARALELLRAVPLTKVSVAKQTIRLIGELGGRDAYPDLLRIAGQPLHRDVRIALLRALWDHLDRAPTWPLLRVAVDDPDPVVASRIAQIPHGNLSSELEARLVPLLARLLARPEPEARQALLAGASSASLRDERREFWGVLRAHIATPDAGEAVLALQAALARMRPDEAPALAEAILAAQNDVRRFLALLGSLTMRLGHWASPATKAVADGVIDGLAEVPAFAPERLTLVGRVQDTRGVAAELKRLEDRGWLSFDVMVVAFEVVRRVASPGLLEGLLHDPERSRLRRIGLAALVESARPENGWTARRRQRLQSYQSDPDPSVFGAARRVYLPPEEDGTT